MIIFKKTMCVCVCVYIPIYYNAHDDDGFVWFMFVKLCHILKVTKQIFQSLKLIKIINEMVGQK